MRHLTRRELAALPVDKAKRYCADLRSFLIRTVQESGGHLASNLGIVEISTALCRVLDPERDVILYDTGHQCYVHKILTGRGERFSTLRSLGGLSGFPTRSEADAFGTGHSGTGLSAAIGFARAARLRGEDSFVAVVIGDGSFTGGMVFEALNNIRPDDRIILILNDNQMSISRSVGSLKRAFHKMRTRGYYRFKGSVRQALLRVPAVGKSLADAAKRVKDSIKYSTIPEGNLFEQFGLNYFGPADGNDLETVEFLLSEAKKKDRPSILHLCTKKGKGYPPAEKDPSRFHGISPKGAKKSDGKSFTSAFSDAICALAARDERIVAVTAAMPDGVGLTDFARRFPDRFFDVGIAEEHAMTFAASLAAGGLKPCFAVYSTFFQRALDQFLHDAALQKLPAVVCLDRAGLVGEDGATHHGLFDVSMILPIPSVRLYAPISEKEMHRALTLAFAENEAPSVIRYPKGTVDPALTELFSCEGAIEHILLGDKPQPDLVLVGYGRTLSELYRTAKALCDKGLTVKLVRFFTLKGFSPEALSEHFDKGDSILFAEEGIRQGGFSSYLCDQLNGAGLSPSAYRIAAVNEAFVPHGSTEQLLDLTGLTCKHLTKEALLLHATRSLSV